MADDNSQEQDERAFEEWYKRTFTARARAAVDRNDSLGMLFFKKDVRLAYFAGKKDASNDAADEIEQLRERLDYAWHGFPFADFEHRGECVVCRVEKGAKP